MSVSFRAKLPAFSKINLDNIETDLDVLLKNNVEKINKLCEQSEFSWDNLLQPLENLSDALHQLWSPIQHLSAVVNAPRLRDIMRTCLPKLSDYHTHLSHHEKLFHAIGSVKNSSAFSKLSPAQQKAIEYEIRDFKLNGVALSAAKKARFAEITKALSQQTNQFEENVLDATMAYKKHITDEKLLSGIPEHAKNAAKQAAKKEGLGGYIFSLEAPDYIAIMTHADSAELRQDIYHAYVTRASDIGPY